MQCVAHPESMLTSAGGTCTDMLPVTACSSSLSTVVSITLVHYEGFKRSQRLAAGQTSWAAAVCVQTVQAYIVASLYRCLLQCYIPTAVLSHALVVLSTYFVIEARL